MAGEPLALGDLIVGSMPTAGQGVRAEVEPFVRPRVWRLSRDVLHDRQPWSGRGDVRDRRRHGFAASGVVPAQMVPGRQSTWRVASGVIGARALPPGRYIARAQITRDGKTVGVLLVRSSSSGCGRPRRKVADAAAVNRVCLVAAEIRSRARRAQARDPRADPRPGGEAFAETLKDAMVAARAGRYGAGALEALSAGDQTVACILARPRLLCQRAARSGGDATADSAGPRREFFPAAFYLGACLPRSDAIATRRECGSWRWAASRARRLSTRWSPTRGCATARSVSAIEILKPAYERDQ